MKKFAVLLLCFMLALSFSGCGKKSDIDDEKDKTEDIQEDETSEEDKDSQEDEDIEEEDSVEVSSALEISNGDYSDFQTALSTFITDYLNTKAPSMESLDTSEEASAASLELLGLYLVDMSIVEVPMFDALDLTGSGGDKITGNLMLSGFEATKEKDGDKIRFGYTHTYEEAEYGNEAGDIIKTEGLLDTSKKVLVMESTRIRGGQLGAKTVMEIARLKDDSFNMQNLHYDSSSMSQGQSCVFLTTTTDSLTAILGEGEPVVDFEYVSLMDKADVTTEEMAQGYTQSMTVRINGSEVSIEK